MKYHKSGKVDPTTKEFFQSMLQSSSVLSNVAKTSQGSKLSHLLSPPKVTSLVVGLLDAQDEYLGRSVAATAPFVRFPPKPILNDSSSSGPLYHVICEILSYMVCVPQPVPSACVEQSLPLFQNEHGLDDLDTQSPSILKLIKRVHDRLKSNRFVKVRWLNTQRSYHGGKGSHECRVAVSGGCFPHVSSSG